MVERVRMRSKGKGVVQPRAASCRARAPAPAPHPDRRDYSSTLGTSNTFLQAWNCGVSSRPQLHPHPVFPSLYYSEEHDFAYIKALCATIRVYLYHSLNSVISQRDHGNSGARGFEGSRYQPLRPPSCSTRKTQTYNSILVYESRLERDVRSWLTHSQATTGLSTRSCQKAFTMRTKIALHTPPP